MSVQVRNCVAVSAGPWYSLQFVQGSDFSSVNCTSPLTGGFVGALLTPENHRNFICFQGQGQSCTVNLGDRGPNRSTDTGNRPEKMQRCTIRTTQIHTCSVWACRKLQLLMTDLTLINFVSTETIFPLNSKLEKPSQSISDQWPNCNSGENRKMINHKRNG